jgi:FtsP/CotA-like multicopper oxidase with cupredoxin domain
MRRRRIAIGVALAVAVLAPVAWLWWSSLLPGTYSIMEMGYADFGGGAGASQSTNGHADHTEGLPSSAHAAHLVEGPGGAAPVSLDALTGPQAGTADVSATLIARSEMVRIENGRPVQGYTLNGSSPGPTITADVGDLVEVRLVNESVPEGVTLHWHGYDVPNAEDGVAGVTQNAVSPGSEHVYRFVAADPGTYWYHTHQVSHRLVRQGMFGVLVVHPKAAGSQTQPLDVVAAVHTYSGQRTINGRVGESRVAAPTGAQVRVRLVNTNDGAMQTWVSGAPFAVAAVDGRDLHQPVQVSDRYVDIGAGGRVDLLFSVPPAGAVRVGAGGGQTSLVVGPAGAAAPDATRPRDELDLLAYGTPAPVAFDPWSADRVFDYDIGRRPWFLDGRPGLWWTVNGHVFPNIPMFVVDEGDVVRMRIANHSGQAHPMHLHGHHVLVLSRNGKGATGSPLWVDSLNVKDGEEYQVAFVADNPGIWMDHCHNLPHAAEGLVAHLAYRGVTTPYLIGGPAQNEPE